MDRNLLAAEVERNYDYFQRHLKEYLPDQFGRYALLRHCKVVGFFDDARRAEERGEQFPDSLYSIQLIGPAPVNLGLYSNG